jgi:hypothetical protein
VYTHDNGGSIEVRENSIQGNIVASFINSTPVSQVKTFFENL